MQEKRTVDDEITKFLTEMNRQHENTDSSAINEDKIETIHVYIYHEEPKQNTIVDADNPKDTAHSFGLVIACFIFSLLPILSIAFQIFVFFHPPTAIITILPIQKELSARADIQLVTTNPGPNEMLSHLLAPITLSQSKIALATGRGHQNAAYAQGTITFYNGSSTSQTIPQRTQLTGNDGVHVVTDDAVIIPPATSSTPPTFGSVSVNAHAIFTGPGGNIEPGDINTYSLGTSILSQNTYAFRGGMNERDFRFVISSDISNVLLSLKAEVSQRVQTKLFSEVSVGQSLISPSCSSSIHSDHKPGDEATQVNVTISQTCMAMTYDTASLDTKGSQILMNLAQNTLGVHYFPIFGITINVLHASMHNILPIRAMISVSIQGTWVYQFSKSDITFLQAAIAGKPINTALKEIQLLPEVKEVRIQFRGFGNSYFVPKDQKYIQIALLYRLA